MPVYLLLKSGFPNRLPKLIARCESPDLTQARRHFAYLHGVPLDVIASDSKAAISTAGGRFVELEPRSLHDDGTPRKKPFPAAMRARRIHRKPKP